MTVQLVGIPREEGVVHVTAKLTMHGQVPGQITLDVELPAGSLLLEGTPKETLPKMERGETVERHFLVDLGKGQLRISARSRGVGGAVNVHAHYPEETPERTALPGRVEDSPRRSIPKVQYKGLNLENAIPLNRKNDTPAQ